MCHGLKVSSTKDWTNCVAVWANKGKNLSLKEMHYSIIIQGKPLNGSFTWDNPYRFNNPYITIIKVLFTPTSTSDVLFSNIDQINTVSNSKGESVLFDKGYYTLSQVIVMLNQMQYIILNIQCNYKFWMYPDEFQ